MAREAVFGQIGSERIEGEYIRSINFGPGFTETIAINPDSTFEYRRSGDVYNNQGSTGKFIATGENTYLANSFDQPPDYRFTVTMFAGVRESLQVTVLDYKTQKPFKKSSIAVSYSDTTQSYNIPSSGTVNIPVESIHSIMVVHTEFVSCPVSPRVSSIIFRINADAGYVYITNRKWKIEAGNLWREFQGLWEEYNFKKSQ